MPSAVHAVSDRDSPNEPTGVDHRHGDSTRSSLLRRARTADQSAWDELVSIYWRVIYRYSRQSGLGHEECEDLVQQVFIEMTDLLPKLEYDRERGRFRGLLKTIVRRRVIDHLRRTQRAGRSVAIESLVGREAPAAGSSADDLWERAWRGGILQVAMERAAAQVEPVTFQAFQLATINQIPPKQIAKILGMSLDSVYAARSRVSHRIRVIYESLLLESKDDSNTQ